MEFYSHVICLGTKISNYIFWMWFWFYSHVICLGTKIYIVVDRTQSVFYSHVICLGTKIDPAQESIFYGFTVT